MSERGRRERHGTSSRAKKDDKKREREKQKDNLVGAVRGVEYVLWFELFLGIIWFILMVTTLFVAEAELIFLVVSAFHASSTLAAIICLEFFVYKHEEMSTFTNLLWQVPAVIALATDIIISASAFKTTLFPQLQGEPGEITTPLWLAWAIFLFTFTLIITSIIYLILFFRIGSLTRSIQSGHKYLPV